MFKKCAMRNAKIEYMLIDYTPESFEELKKFGLDVHADGDWQIYPNFYSPSTHTYYAGVHAVTGGTFPAPGKIVVKIHGLWDKPMFLIYTVNEFLKEYDPGFIYNELNKFCQYSRHFEDHPNSRRSIVEQALSEYEHTAKYGLKIGEAKFASKDSHFGVYGSYDLRYCNGVPAEFWNKIREIQDNYKMAKDVEDLDDESWFSSKDKEMSLGFRSTCLLKDYIRLNLDQRPSGNTNLDVYEHIKKYNTVAMNMGNFSVWKTWTRFLSSAYPASKILFVYRGDENEKLSNLRFSGLNENGGLGGNVDVGVFLPDDSFYSAKMRYHHWEKNKYEKTTSEHPVYDMIILVQPRSLWSSRSWKGAYKKLLANKNQTVIECGS